MSDDREFDVVIFGATGFTGALAAEHLARKYGKSGKEINWGIAGRNEKKLKKTLSKVAKQVGDWVLEDGAIPLIIADSGDKESLNAMCSLTKVVVSTVGPFLRYGPPLVKACIDNKTDYCDITGESTFIRRMIDDYGEEAKAAGIRLVPSSGYDSLPSDLGAMVLVDFAKKENPDAKIKKVTHFVGPMKGEASGGTIGTMMALMGEEEKSMLAKVYGNPYALCEGGFKGKDSGELRVSYFNKDVQKTVAPWFMASANERLVRRSAFLLTKRDDLEYGKAFQYQEVLVMQNTLAGIFVTIAMSVGFALIALLPPLRWLLEKYVLPKPGTGPSRKTMETGYAFSYMHTAIDGEHYLCDVSIAGGDCGYKSTGMMVSEVGVALAKSRGSYSGIKAGFQTPASCPGLGFDLMEPLKTCDITFTPRKVGKKQLPQIVQPYNSGRPLLKNE